MVNFKRKLEVLKKMLKKRILYLFLVFFFIVISAIIISVKANPISSVVIVYNSGTKQLDVTITHNNGGSSTHIVDEVNIKVNGSSVKTEFYANQPSVTFTYNYDNLTADPGATIQVTAFCTISGAFSNSIVVPGGTNPNGNGNGEPSIPGYLGLLIIVATSSLALLFIHYKKIKRKSN